MERRTWRKWAGLAAVVVGSFVLLGGAARAAGRHMHDPARFEQLLGKKLEKMLDEVKATPEQRQQIVAIKDELAAKRKAMRGDRRADHEELLAQWSSPNPDMNRIHARLDERSKELTAFGHEVADALARVHAILTPEQRAQVAEKLREHHGRRRGAAGPG